MILLIDPISKNPGVYVPAYPLPVLEIGSFIKFHMPEEDIRIISVPTDYGLPLNTEGKRQIYDDMLREISELRPCAVGVSCTAISQAEETIHLCEQIKKQEPDVFIFLGGYFPTIYYEEILDRTSSIDLIVKGEGELPALKIVESLTKGLSPVGKDIPNLVWKQGDRIMFSEQGIRFDLEKKTFLNLDLLRHPDAYDVMPYSFSRGCPYRCNFCMEEYIRPSRKEVPAHIIEKDLKNLSSHMTTHKLLINDSLFNSFDLFYLIRSLGMKITFETRCDIMEPSIIPKIADVCGLLALGFESASYGTLKRMNKVRDRSHYKRYISNTVAIFEEAVKCEIPLMIFMIAGYPGDTEEDLEMSLEFVKELSRHKGPGGHIFKIGECRAYPKTKTYDFAKSLGDVVFDDDSVFGQNIVRRPSRDLDFDTVCEYMQEIFGMHNITPALTEAIYDTMPFFRLPSHSLTDDLIPGDCFNGEEKDIFNVRAGSLSLFRRVVPRLIEKYEGWMSKERAVRNLNL